MSDDIIRSGAISGDVKPATPKVSIIMPVYNVEKYLRQCIDSVISQTLPEIEIICVNDGSSDTSGKILNEYSTRDKRIHVINKKNSGYGHTMNCGLDAAIGEYVGIVETDDYVHAEMFSTLYNLAKTHDADLVKSNYYTFTSEKTNSSRFLVDLCRGLPVEKIFSPIKQCNDFLYLQPCIWAAIYRREFLEQNRIRFNETPGASYQDTSFAFRVHAMTDRALLTNKPFYHYRTDNENSSVNAAAKIFSVCDEYRVIEEYFSARPERSAAMQSIITRAKCDTYLWNYRRLGAEYQYAFLLTMANELGKERVMGRLPLEKYPVELKMEIGELLTNLDAFFKRTAKAYNGNQERLGQYEHNGYYGMMVESNKITNSASYRIGMAITWLPRKIRGGFRCWKQHGLTYTLRLFKNKLFGKR